MHPQNHLFSRILYCLAILAWCLLLWPSPSTVFLAACVSCISLPLYRKLVIFSYRFQKHIRHRYHEKPQEKREKFIQRKIFSFKLSAVKALPTPTYLLTLICSIALPVSIFTILIAPQVGTGLTHMRNLWANNFQIPPVWSAYIDGLITRFQSMPIVAKILDEGRSMLSNAIAYFSDLSTETVTELVSKGVKLLGGTMSVLWSLFLFFCLTVTFVFHAKRIRSITARVCHLQSAVLKRFITAIRKALVAILLGVLFVAVIQGVLCGIGFAFVGISQFAFWGLVAALVAPIPTVGTALVWGPLCIQLWFTGQTMAAIGLALWSAGIVSTADSILRPLFLRQGIKASYLVLILVMLCGIATFGAIGIILGPTLLAFSIQAIEEGNRSFLIGSKIAHR